MAIENAIEEGEDQMIAAVVLGSKLILGSNIPGIRILTDSLNAAIMMVLQQDLDSDDINGAASKEKDIFNDNVPDNSAMLGGGKFGQQVRATCLRVLAFSIDNYLAMIIIHCTAR